MEKDEKLAQVFHYDLYGKRAEKYDFLLNNNLQTVQWRELELIEPQYFFVAKDFSLKEEYEKGFSIQKLFSISVLGFQSHRDNFAISFEKDTIYKRVTDLIGQQFTNDELYSKYNLRENRDWNLTNSRKEIRNDLNWKNKIIICGYRPLDNRPCYFSYVTMDYPRKELIQHVLNKDNLCLNVVRQTKMNSWKHVLVSNIPTSALFVEIKDGSTVFPLYLYPESDKLFSGEKRKPNLNESIINEISQRISLQFTEEKEETENTFAPIDVLDYIYAVLHSPSYREKYKEFLKIDFPRVPYPENAEKFWNLAQLGGKLRRLHLLEGVEPQQGMANYPIAGSNEVAKPEYVDGKVYINETQYFENVPLVAWNFYIGGYQPAQKWLKDRKGRTLGYDDIWHYQKVIFVLKETGEVMKEVDEVIGNYDETRTQKMNQNERNTV